MSENARFFWETLVTWSVVREDFKDVSVARERDAKTSLLIETSSLSSQDIIEHRNKRN